MIYCPLDNKIIKKVLIANRGEIACKIIRVLKEMGIITIAIYSDVDSCALHTKISDEKASLHGNSPADSYNNIEKIIDIAKAHEADAVHPGYGFLAENFKFAEACYKENIIFIGPSYKNIRDMGDKIIAKDIAIESCMPVVPGIVPKYNEKTDKHIEAIEDFIKLNGLPIILKAAAGGGGRGK
jgi:acetyl/propionyl-CoA carboxylase alpha subunit